MGDLSPNLGTEPKNDGGATWLVPGSEEPRVILKNFHSAKVPQSLEHLDTDQEFTFRLHEVTRLKVVDRECEMAPAQTSFIAFLLEQTVGALDALQRFFKVISPKVNIGQPKVSPG